jgi:starch synthase (maltosyl-transferring)
MKDYFRPNFWPSTPDVLPFHLQQGGRPAFITRFILASTLSSNYGIYGPAFELCCDQAWEGKEEYYNSEKYELKHWNWDQSGNIKDLIAHVNKIRRDHPALQLTSNVKFCDTDNVNLFSYYKTNEDLSDMILVTVNLDAFHVQSGWVRVPLNKLGISFDQPYKMIDLITSDEFVWQGEWNYVELNPQIFPAHIFKVVRM